MSARNLDGKGRFRSITVGFRVSPEEHETLNRIVKLSGLSKQEYCYRKCTECEIIVEANPKIFKALKLELLAVYNELQRIENVGNVTEELIEVIKQISMTLNGFKGENGGDFN